MTSKAVLDFIDQSDNDLFNRMLLVGPGLLAKTYIASECNFTAIDYDSDPRPPYFIDNVILPRVVSVVKMSKADFSRHIPREYSLNHFSFKERHLAYFDFGNHAEGMLSVENRVNVWLTALYRYSITALLAQTANDIADRICPERGYTADNLVDIRNQSVLNAADELNIHPGLLPIINEVIMADMPILMYKHDDGGIDRFSTDLICERIEIEPVRG